MIPPFRGHFPDITPGNTALRSQLLFILYYKLTGNASDFAQFLPVFPFANRDFPEIPSFFTVEKNFLKK